MNTVNDKVHREYTAKAKRKHIRQVANRMVVECNDWRRDLAQSYLDVVESENEENRPK